MEMNKDTKVETESPKNIKISNNKWIETEDEFLNWAAFTTIHGVPIIFRAPNLALRLFWLALFLTSSTLCCLMLAKIFTQYFSYEVVTKIRSVPKRSLPFGAFTFCNQKFFATHQGYEAVRDRLREKFHVNISTYHELVKYSEEFNVSVLEEIERFQREAFAKGLANATLVEKYGYSINDFFFKKTFDNNDIENRLIKMILDPTFGNCFRINSDLEFSKFFEANSSEVSMHLEMFTGSLANPLAYTYTTNIEIEINSIISYPFNFKTNFLSRGKHTNLVLSANKVQVMPKPFSDCVDIEENPPAIVSILKEKGIEYSREICINYYHQLEINIELNCFYPYYPNVLDNVTEPCDPIQPTWNYEMRKVGSEKCPQECNRYIVLSSTSTELFPTRTYAQEMLMRRPEYFERVFNKSVNEITYEMIRDNFCSLSIRFDSLSVTELTEEPAVSFVGLISNLGGIAGLFIAVSFLSFMELIDLGVSIAIIFCKSLFKKTK